MGSRAEVNQITTLVGCHIHVVGDLARDELDFERIVLEEFKCLLLRQDQPLKVLLLLRNFLRACLKVFVVLVGYGL